LIFFIPGIEETLRINGKAWLSRNQEILGKAQVNGKQPKLAICVEVEELFFHCAKALKRSRLWDPAVQVERKSMPPLARIILEQVSADGCADESEVEEREAYIQENYRASLY
jgi:predicted pyridoxine 5'-phosphate oxidase superfamily flavin-nucleotide-binding protein